jgi:glutamyl-Q tRNA(Asp) synthetase
VSATEPFAGGCVGRYVGRFAPSPTGPLHAGSLVAALASWLDARAAGGRWLLRIEDADRPRCPPGTGEHILQQLAACGLQPDAPPLWQSRRDAAYASALERLRAGGHTFPCGCTRREVDGVYPGTCRDGLHGKPQRAIRFRVPAEASVVGWRDRRLGQQQQDVAAEVGDFVLHRADGVWAYQLAVVVDDAEQGVSHIVRGEDLADNTARQILLQRALQLPTPVYLHTPLVLAADGHKLSKQNGAEPLDLSDPAAALRAALQVLEMPAAAATAAALLENAVDAWGRRWPLQAVATMAR